MTLVKCYSVLVVSGNGGRCKDLKYIITDELNAPDDVTKKSKSHIFKYEKKSSPKDFIRISNALTMRVAALFTDVNELYFADDINKSHNACT